MFSVFASLLLFILFFRHGSSFLVPPPLLASCLPFLFSSSPSFPSLLICPFLLFCFLACLLFQLVRPSFVLFFILWSPLSSCSSRSSSPSFSCLSSQFLPTSSFLPVVFFLFYPSDLHIFHSCESYLMCANMTCVTCTFGSRNNKS